MKWSEDLQKSIIRSWWDNHLDQIKNIIYFNKILYIKLLNNPFFLVSTSDYALGFWGL